MTTTFDAAGTLSLLISVVLPILVALVTREHEKPWVKSTLLLVLSLALSVAKAVYDDVQNHHAIIWQGLLYFFILNFVTGVASNFGLLNQIGLTGHGGAASKALVKEKNYKAPATHAARLDELDGKSYVHGTILLGMQQKLEKLSNMMDELQKEVKAGKEDVAKAAQGTVEANAAIAEQKYTDANPLPPQRDTAEDDVPYLDSLNAGNPDINLADATVPVKRTATAVKAPAKKAPAKVAPAPVRRGTATAVKKVAARKAPAKKV